MPLTQTDRDNILQAQAGTKPTYSARLYAIEPTTRPKGPSDGFLVKSQTLGQALVSAACVDLDRSYQECAIIVDSVAAGDYIATINGEDYTVTATGSETATQLLTSLTSLINAASGVCNATAEVVTLAGGTTPAMIVTATTIDDPTWSVSANLQLNTAATSVDFAIWLYDADDSGDPDWGVASGYILESQTRSYRETVYLGPATRMAIQVITTDGLVSWRVGPCKATT